MNARSNLISPTGKDTWHPYISFVCTKCGKDSWRLYGETRNRCIGCGHAHVSRKKSRKLSPSVVFTRSREWKNIRGRALEKYGTECLKCGSSENIQVDHIKPKSQYPELALDIENLQPLCWDCNKKKGVSEIDYRNNYE